MGILTEKPLPEAVNSKIVELKRLETELGHLPPENWAVDELHRRTIDPNFSFHASQMEQRTELLFGNICDELAEVGFDTLEIARAINTQLQYPNGPAYCNEAEVRQSLGL